MTHEEFEILLRSSNGLITVSDLKNKSNRTLLLGLSGGVPDYVSHHVYLFDGQIYVYHFNSLFPELCKEINVSSNWELLPSKSIYPFFSDFEFLLLLKEKSCPLSFYPFIEREKEVYNGRLLPEHESCFEDE